MNFIEYIKARWAQYRSGEATLRRRLSKIRTERPYETSIVNDMGFYVLSTWLVCIGVVFALFLAGVAMALINGGLWWITGLIVGA